MSQFADCRYHQW